MTKEEAIRIISGYEVYGCGYCLQGGDEVEEALRMAVDALRQETVIRCKDCKYWGEDGYHHGCKYANCIMEENDYCSMAERKEMDDKKTCYNCKHGAFGFDGDLGCSLWHRGIYDQKICGCWEGFERKEK